VAARRTSDPQLALAVLGKEERATVLAWLTLFLLEPDELAAIPPLEQLVNMIACKTLAARMPDLSQEEAFRAAERELGIGNQRRTWYRWQRNAYDMLSGRD
jgi:hypothetical protein